MRQAEKEWRCIELLQTTAAYFEEKQVSEARLSAELLLCHVLKESRLQLYLQHSRPVYPDELAAFRALCRKRLEGWPVQYLTGEQFFFGRAFMVDPRVLIPRPETELVLEHALERFSRSGGTRGTPEILDIGTGSGCIAVTAALQLPGAQITAVDLSGEALEVARENARTYGVESSIRFIETDMFAQDFLRGHEDTFDLIVSNPPYIPDSEWDDLQIEVRNHEPRMALTASGGLECYRAVTCGAARLLRRNGLLCFELHADGARSVSGLMQEIGFRYLELQKDYSGCDRILSAMRGDGPEE